MRRALSGGGGLRRGLPRETVDGAGRRAASRPAVADTSRRRAPVEQAAPYASRTTTFVQGRVKSSPGGLASGHNAVEYDGILAIRA